jgi:hypothetical protein
MTRGILFIAVWRRTGSDSFNYKDKWEYVDKLKLSTVSTEILNHTKFRVDSLRKGLRSFIISKDELAFVRLISGQYGPGNYCIKIWAKGKNKGIRIFWDGIISTDKKFLRKRNTGYYKTSSSLYERSSFSLNSESFVGKYMKTKMPGTWHSI